MRRWLALGLVVLTGCEGQLAGPRDETKTRTDVPSAPLDCETRGQGSVARMRLLWRTAFLSELDARLAPGASTAAASVGLSPATDKRFNFETAGALLTDATVDSLATTADAVAVWALSSDATASAVFGCNARTISGAGAEQCFADFLRNKGSRLLRRPLSSAELDDTVAFFRSQAALGESDGVQEGFRQGLASLVMHPDFLYVRDVPAQDGATLAPFSLAQRVSFALTGAGPDDALFAAALDGSLSSPEGLSAQVDRLLATPAARERSQRFFRQWLRYDGWSLAYSDAFLDGFDPISLQADATHELDAFIDDTLWAKRGTAADLLVSRATAPLPASLATIYAAPIGATTLPEARAGLLTRVGLLASGADDWHVVARGLTVLEKLLCRDMSPPNINVAAAIAQAESLKISNADRIAAVTAPTACAGCHQQINPLGAARSDFDALGRAVSVERHFAGGAFDFEVPVVARGDLSAVLAAGGTVDGSRELSRALATSPEYQRCFAMQFVRASLGRADASDACLAFDGAAVLSQGGSMVDAMRAVVLSPEFKRWKE